MKTNTSPFVLAATLLTFASPANAQVALDFSGTQTAITDGSGIIGFSFHNFYGDGSDAILDVVWNRTASNHPELFAGPSNNPATLSLSDGGVHITNGYSDGYTGTATPPSSLAIYLFTGANSSFTSGTVTQRFDFFLHDSSGNTLDLAFPVGFVTRDLDGNQPNPSISLYEGITVYDGEDFGVVNPSWLSLSGNTITAPSNATNIDATTSTDGTASWTHSGSSWSWDLTLHMEEGSGTWADVSSSRGFVFDALVVPEPSGLLLLSLTGTLTLLRRRRNA